MTVYIDKRYFNETSFKRDLFSTLLQEDLFSNQVNNNTFSLWARAASCLECSDSWILSSAGASAPLPYAHLELWKRSSGAPRFRTDTTYTVRVYVHTRRHQHESNQKWDLTIRSSEWPKKLAIGLILLCKLLLCKCFTIDFSLNPL